MRVFYMRFPTEPNTNTIQKQYQYQYRWNAIHTNCNECQPASENEQSNNPSFPSIPIFDWFLHSWIDSWIDRGKPQLCITNYLYTVLRNSPADTSSFWFFVLFVSFLQQLRIESEVEWSGLSGVEWSGLSGVEWSGVTNGTANDTYESNKLGINQSITGSERSASRQARNDRQCCTYSSTYRSGTIHSLPLLFFWILLCVLPMLIVWMTNEQHNDRVRIMQVTGIIAYMHGKFECTIYIYIYIYIYNRSGSNTERTHANNTYETKIKWLNESIPSIDPSRFGSVGFISLLFVCRTRMDESKRNGRGLVKNVLHYTSEQRIT